jgi:hypothetical protein
MADVLLGAPRQDQMQHRCSVTAAEPANIGTFTARLATVKPISQLSTRSAMRIGLAFKELVPLTVMGALFAGSAPAAAVVVEPVPVGPNQYFVGEVNGRRDVARIAVTCDMSTGPQSVGHSVPGQTIAVRQVVVTTDARSAPNVGFTGSRGALIGVGEAHGNSATKLTALPYNYPFQIPENLDVPCAGVGVIVFEAIPSSSTARHASVEVTFFTIG